jgi:hypothetical protein
MLDVLYVAPTIWITILQPNKRRANIRWTVLGVVNNNRLFAPGWHEDLDSVIPTAAPRDLTKSRRLIPSPKSEGIRKLSTMAERSSPSVGEPRMGLAHGAAASTRCAQMTAALMT